MLAVEKPKQPKVIKYVWWDGFNKEEVEKVFPTVGFSNFSASDEGPYQVRILLSGNRVWDIKGGVYLCCEVGSSDVNIFTLSKQKFEEAYLSIPKEYYDDNSL